MIERSLGTHDGSFHADEVTAAGLLILFGKIDQDKIIRTRDQKILNTCEYVCDVGGIYDSSIKRFDHHQVQYKGDLSSAGMVWLYLKEQDVVDQATYNFFNEALIMGVDAHDNGTAAMVKGHCSFSGVISNFVPASYEAPPEELDSAFHAALDFALGHLQRLLLRHRYIQKCRELVAEAMAKGSDCLIFDRAMPWMDSFFSLGGEEHPARFVVMPTGDHWKLRGVPPKNSNRMQLRKPLPAQWAGRLEDELKEITGIRGAIFCHKGRFISVWETKEDALKALELVQKKDKK